MAKVYNPGNIVQCKLNFTTDGSGNATVESSDVYIGYLEALQLIDGDVADLVDIVVTCEQGDLSIPILTKADWNTDQMVYPRVLQALNTDGTALTTHTRHIVSGKLKIVIAQGGDTKTGAVIFYIAGQ
jgi:hypothetical protein